MHRTFNKILIIRFSSLGDVILATPLVRVLRGAYPSAQIDFLVKAEYTDLLRNNHHLTSVIQLKTSTREELKLLRQQVRRERYDLIIDLHNSIRSRYIRWFAGAKNVKIVNKRVLPRFVLVHFKKNLYPEAVPVAQRYLETVRRFGVTDDSAGLALFIPDDTRATVKVLMSRYHLDRYDTVVGLAPTSKHATKRWLPERFVEFGVKLVKSRRAKLFVFGDTADRDDCSDIVQMINADAGLNVAENMAGQLSILETAAAFDDCDLVVTNDSGLLHLAAARKRRLLAIFGSTVKEFGFFPYGTESAVVETHGLSCRPCTHIGRPNCPKGHFKCMKDIQTVEVLSAAEQLLSNCNKSVSI